jgi:hypothetical protein
MAFNSIGPLYPRPAYDGAGNQIPSQSLTVSTAAVAAAGFAIPAAGGPEMVTFDVQGVDVRCRWDGTDPTGSVGHVLPAGSAYTWWVTQWNNAKFIRISTAATDATLFASGAQA